MANIGYIQSEQHKQKINTPERAKKISNTLKLKYENNVLTAWNKGRKLTKAHKLKIKKWANENFSGNKHPFWKGGLPKCLKCKKTLATYNSKRCLQCSFTGKRRQQISVSHKGIPEKDRLEIGSLSIRKCKRGQLRRFIKIAYPSKWIEYSQYLWGIEKRKKGYVIHHINGDPLDDRIENLIELSRAEHCKLHRSNASFGAFKINPIYNDQNN